MQWGAVLKILNILTVRQVCLMVLLTAADVKKLFASQFGFVLVQTCCCCRLLCVVLLHCICCTNTHLFNNAGPAHRSMCSDYCIYTLNACGEQACCIEKLLSQGSVSHNCCCAVGSEHCDIF